MGSTFFFFFSEEALPRLLPSPPRLEEASSEFLPRGRARRSANPRLGRGGAQTQGSGEAEPALRGRREAEPAASVSSEAETAPPRPHRLGEAEPAPEARRDEASPQKSGEAEPAERS